MPTAELRLPRRHIVCAPGEHWRWTVAATLRQPFRALVVAGGPVDTFELACGEGTLLVSGSPGGWSVAHVLADCGSQLVPLTVDATAPNLDMGEVLIYFEYEESGRRGQPAIECVEQHERIDPDTGDTIAIDFRSFVCPASTAPPGPRGRMA